MAERNVSEKPRALPQKIEQRLADLQQMGEFDQGDVNHCRRAYWAARADWHKILVDCYEEAQRRVFGITISRASAPTERTT